MIQCFMIWVSIWTMTMVIDKILLWGPSLGSIAIEIYKGPSKHNAVHLTYCESFSSSRKMEVQAQGVYKMLARLWVLKDLKEMRGVMRVMDEIFQVLTDPDDADSFVQRLVYSNSLHGSTNVYEHTAVPKGVDTGCIRMTAPPELYCTRYFKYRCSAEADSNASLSCAILTLMGSRCSAQKQKKGIMDNNM
eukprot:Gb_16462 [translate_table: standard]